MDSRWMRSIAAVCAAVIIAMIAGCGSSPEVVTMTRTRDATTGGSLTAAPAANGSGGSSSGNNAGAYGSDSGSAPGSVPIMPNVDETQLDAVTLAATSAYEGAWGDGSGVNVVWGPNIISGWALTGIENNSGAAGKDVLLALENGVWIVKDMGHALSEKWKSQTPAALWPSI